MCRDLWNWQTKNPQGYDTIEQSYHAESTSKESKEYREKEPVRVIPRLTRDADRTGEQAQLA